jgi:hypothetical protein
MKGRYVYEDGGTVIHVFFKQTKTPKHVEVPLRRAVWVDPSAGRYEMIDGRMRRIDKDRPRVRGPEIIVRRKAA